MGITVRNLCKSFGGFRAVHDVSFDVGPGELVALLGPSGSGKSTVLRIIAGLEAPDSGQVLLTGEDATDVPVRDRGVGFVFQHYALFKHMTVRDNVAFGLSVRGEKRDVTDKRVRELLRMVQLAGLEDRYPDQLSGGQRQRVALARALATQPKVLLLDEPFAALDAKVREELRNWIRRMHREFHVTSLFVTHDREEAMELCDKIVVLKDGRVEQVGTPMELYERPATPFVASFLGPVNVLTGRNVDGRLILSSNTDSDPYLSHPPVTAYVRPHELDILPHQPVPSDVDGSKSSKIGLRAVVRRCVPVGGIVKITLERSDGAELHVQVTRERFGELSLSVGQEIVASAKEMRVFTEDYSI
jgi:sulfate transport system ATP-binding protein